MSTLLHAAAHAHDSRVGFDPRASLLAAVAISVVTVAAARLDTVGLSLGAAVVALLARSLVRTADPTGLARVPVRMADPTRRLLPLNALMVLLMMLLPLSTPGEPLVQLGPMRFSREGLWLAIGIAMKGNAVLLWLIALLGTMDPITLGHALSHLRVPDKLTHLLLFTVRYLDVLHREYLRLRAAMRARGFRPRLDRHTCRSLGYLVGMLLVRSFDRAERILAAMKCRGFQGHFFILDHFTFRRRDALFCAAATVFVCLLLMMEMR